MKQLCQTRRPFGRGAARQSVRYCQAKEQAPIHSPPQPVVGPPAAECSAERDGVFRRRTPTTCLIPGFQLAVTSAINDRKVAGPTVPPRPEDGSANGRGGITRAVRNKNKKKDCLNVVDPAAFETFMNLPQTLPGACPAQIPTCLFTDIAAWTQRVDILSIWRVASEA